jgi:hypothetical protein
LNIAPVAYASGYTPRVEVLFTNDAQTYCESSTVVAKGDVYIDNILVAKLPPKQLELGVKYGTEKMIMPEDPNSLFIFEKFIVRYIPLLTIKWYINSNQLNQNSWTLIGETKHKTYVTHMTPYEGSNPNGLATDFLETTLHIGCESANGVGNSGGEVFTDDVVGKIYDEFRDQCVKKINGNQCMGYWSGNGDECVYIYQFLEKEDGTCGVWAQFLNEIFRMQGIKRSRIDVVVAGDNFSLSNNTGYLSMSQKQKLNEEILYFFGSDAINVSYADVSGNGEIPFYLFVKNWSFNSSNFYLQLLDEEVGNKLEVPPTLNILEYTKDSGVSAQGENNQSPPSIFANHAIVSYINQSGHTVYLDPSYGTPMENSPGWFIDQNEWESKSLSGYGTLLLYGHKDFNFPIPVIWLDEIETSNTQTSFH